MKAFIIALIVAVAIGTLAATVLNEQQRFAYQAFATSGARVSDPAGHSNLVGPKWNGVTPEPEKPSKS
ncbi:hypothetical protein [Methylobacterium marchantiae]|uniref:Uncharacterized protein n=1 Tax=Methylobacterium marchantiae TaxID=600331 RepID=A0ABW3X0Z6_9HYPH|nr:hypothetical protein AIGOOFII_0720 [Methylobacterium marchantiae]